MNVSSSPEKTRNIPTLDDAWFQLPYAHGGACGKGRLRAFDEDFQVDEDLGFSADGEGEHVLLHVRKRAMNTDQVGRAIAKLAGVPARDVGFAGMKDRNAVTTQSFSVGLAGREEPDWTALNDDRLEVLSAARHARKLRRGALSGNRFVLRIRELDGERECIEQRLGVIAAQGVPNYFGAQRFGRGGGNLARAEAMLVGGRRERDRHKRGLYLSAGRSWLFNRVLAARVADGSWNALLAGEVACLAGSHSVFDTEVDDPSLGQRLACFDIHPSAPLWGRGRLRSRERALELETAALADWADWRDGLEHVGMDQDRRALRLVPGELHWQWSDDDLVLAFSLPAGAYATAVLREVIEAHEGSVDP